MISSPESLPPVLVVDDEPSLREFLSIFLRKQGLEVETAEDGAEAIARVTSDQRYSLVLTDLKMPGEASGLDVLRHVKDVAPATQVVVMTAYATPETAISAIRDGAYDYITKPFKVDQARAVVRRGLEKYRLIAENLYLRRALDADPFDEMVGTSTPMRQVFQLVQRVAPTQTTILLQGESGTGKELVARAIHARSNRSGEFVPVNCGAIPENLIEAELFGYVKGAFTGAESNRAGLFEAATDGTLFLDEIGELPLNTQVRMLRALQERRIKPVGGTKEVPVNVRILAATNRDLRADVEAGLFREDLFYRLNVINIEIPPLRDRPGDIKLLLEHYLRRFAEQLGNPVEGLDAESLRLLLDYGYPGNVRELQNIMERAVTLEMSPLITTSSLPPHVAEQKQAGDSKAFNVTADGVDLDAILGSVEEDLIRQALDLTDGNRTEAAKLLGVTFRSFRYRLDKYGIG